MTSNPFPLFPKKGGCHDRLLTPQSLSAVQIFLSIVPCGRREQGGVAVGWWSHANEEVIGGGSFCSGFPPLRLTLSSSVRE